MRFGVSASSILNISFISIFFKVLCKHKIVLHAQLCNELTKGLCDCNNLVTTFVELLHHFQIPSYFHYLSSTHSRVSKCINLLYHPSLWATQSRHFYLLDGDMEHQALGNNHINGMIWHRSTKSFPHLIINLNLKSLSNFENKACCTMCTTLPWYIWGRSFTPQFLNNLKRVSSFWNAKSSFHRNICTCLWRPFLLSHSWIGTFFTWSQVHKS